MKNSQTPHKSSLYDVGIIRGLTAVIVNASRGSDYPSWDPQQVCTGLGDKRGERTKENHATKHQLRPGSFRLILSNVRSNYGPRSFRSNYGPDR